MKLINLWSVFWLAKCCASVRLCISYKQVFQSCCNSCCSNFLEPVYPWGSLNLGWFEYERKQDAFRRGPKENMSWREFEGRCHGDFAEFRSILCWNTNEPFYNGRPQKECSGRCRDVAVIGRFSIRGFKWMDQNFIRTGKHSYCRKVALWGGDC